MKSPARATGACLVLAVALLRVAADVPVEQTYSAVGSVDQDDMCVWVHPSDPALSTLITSDKFSGEVYIYDLDGNLLQAIPSGMPGNVDVRYGIVLGGECVDLVAFNERMEQKIRVYRVDPETRALIRVDDDDILTGINYGFTLFRREDGALFGVTGPDVESFQLQQYELVDDGSGQVRGTPTGWQFQETKVEGMVGDDERGWIYLAEEDVGIWRVRADDDSDKTLIAAVGDSTGLAADVEGLTIYYLADGQGYLIASSQGADKFTVLDRAPPHAALGEFTVTGVGQTDGVDVSNVSLGERYGQGLLAFHNGSACCPVQTARWDEVVSALPVLQVDTASWHPRRGCGPLLDVGRTELSWTAATPAVQYDVVRGSLDALRDTGDFAAAVTGCLADDLAGTVLPRSDEPAPGSGEWFLVRGVASFGAMSYDSYAATQLAGRDAGIDAAAAACP